MQLDSDACFRAVRARDRRFDGKFFTAVSTTGIYCRPICPVRAPKRENVRFFASAAAAEGAGFRPCLRCRPERAPGLAAVDAAGRLIGAAIAGIEEHALTNARVGDLAASLGVSDRHLRRVTESELGVSPVELAQTQRLLLAKRLLGETSLKLTEIAFASGFGSLRRFNALFKSRYGLNPRSLRRSSADARHGRPDAADGLRCQLDFRPPLAWQALLDYLRLRAIPGIESADATHYRRTVAIGGSHKGEVQGWVAVSLSRGGAALDVEMSLSLAPAVGVVIARLKKLFDLGAAPDSVSALLSQDPMLAKTVRRLPGLRVPGAFDGYELAVRAVLGQQVSVKAATTLAGRWAKEFGAAIQTPFPELNRLTPHPARTAGAAVEELAALGIVRSRARALIGLSEAVNRGAVLLSHAANVEEQIATLEGLPGVGPWTAQYIAMRALHWPDAFPGGDLMLQRAAKAGKNALQERAENWRPWRAYAAHYLWQSLGDVP
jgi:AraC family transcriptional regulator of adaptative response / DNA-3-methyladenine glycosylase II